MQFHIVFLLQYSISLNTVEADPHPNLLHNDAVKGQEYTCLLMCYKTVEQAFALELSFFGIFVKML